MRRLLPHFINIWASFNSSVVFLLKKNLTTMLMYLFFSPPVCVSLLYCCLLSFPLSYWLMTPLGGNTHYVAGADFALCAGLLITVLDFNICRKKSRRVNQPPLKPNRSWNKKEQDCNLTFQAAREHERVWNPLLLWWGGAHSRSLRAKTPPVVFQMKLSAAAGFDICATRRSDKWWFEAWLSLGARAH